jgi:hypothetical protein
MERVLPVVAEIAGRFPQRTVFTRFITPAKPEDMPGMWQRYYQRCPDAAIGDCERHPRGNACGKASKDG